MPAHKQQLVDEEKIRGLLGQKKSRMKFCLAACASCSLCAESCFLFMSHDKDPRYMPSYKVVRSLGRLYKKRGRVNRAQLEEMKELVFRNCALCGRCYCPFGIDIPNMIAFARTILRSQGIYGMYPHSVGGPEAEYRDSAGKQEELSAKVKARN
jgi:Fe-S oxidoreductase